MGIDNDHIDLVVVRFGLPRDLMTYFQERGRTARRPGSAGRCVLYATMSSYVTIMSHILNYNKLTDTTDVSNEELEFRGAGSAITPLAASAQQLLQQRSDKQTTKKKTPTQPYQLSHSMRRQLRHRMLADVRDLLRFFFLDFGCMQHRGAFYMSDGALDQNIDACREADCTHCPICSKAWHKSHLPIFRSQLTRLFDSNTGRNVFPFPVDGKKPLSSVLSSRPYWVEWIFDRAAGSILVRNIDALFLSLVANNIIQMEKNRSGDLVWNLGWIDNITPVYKNDTAWDGIHLRHEDSTRNRTVELTDR